MIAWPKGRRPTYPYEKREPQRSPYSNSSSPHSSGDSGNEQRTNGSCTWRDCRICSQKGASLNLWRCPMSMTSRIRHGRIVACICVPLEWEGNNTVSRKFTWRNSSSTCVVQIISLCSAKSLVCGLIKNILKYKMHKHKFKKKTRSY